jgi:hypothetical protein
MPPDPDAKAISRSIFVDGTERVISYGGTSQYSKDGAGASVCGVASLNFARIVYSEFHSSRLALYTSHF